MGRCPSCDPSSLFGVSTKQCIGCGRVGCDKCLPQLQGLFRMKTTADMASKPSVYNYVGFCSDACAQQFWNRVLKFPLQNEVGTNIAYFNPRVIHLWNQAILGACSKYHVSMVESAIRLHSINNPTFPWIDEKKNFSKIYTDFYNAAKLALAQNLERCGRTQDAANVFEELRMYDKSRELRERNRHIIVKNTNVSVNLNNLLEQVKEGGMVAVFRCPNCGGNLKINKDTTVDSLKVCEYCHYEITSMDLADLMNAIIR